MTAPSAFTEEAQLERRRGSRLFPVFERGRLICSGQIKDPAQVALEGVGSSERPKRYRSPLTRGAGARSMRCLTTCGWWLELDAAGLCLGDWGLIGLGERCGGRFLRGRVRTD